MTNPIPTLSVIILLWYIIGGIAFITIDILKGKDTLSNIKNMIWLAVCCGPLGWVALIMAFMVIGMINLFRRILDKHTISFKII